MTTAVQTPLFEFDNTFARALPELYVDWQGSEVKHPELVAFNSRLAEDLGLDPDRLESDQGVPALAGAEAPPGAKPVAMAYAGHQFGGFSPLLGDGRALLLGEIVDPTGRRHDIHLKGSGRTPFARGGDGKAALGPMLREFLIAEAMHALGIPTTRALAVVTTGEAIAREGHVPGAVLTRVAASHLRVGTFEYAARLDDPGVLVRLADYAIARHHPDAAESDKPYLALLDAVIEAQAELVADWMLVGFIHGVMNTDNMAISGEGIDYGPCAFMDRFDPATVFSSIDHSGRYAYGNQPQVAHWNLARLAETLLPLIDSDNNAAVSAATEALQTFPDRFDHHQSIGHRAKLGLGRATIPDADNGGDDELFDEFMGLLASQQADYTSGFRALAHLLRGDDKSIRSLVDDRTEFDGWSRRWKARLDRDNADVEVVAAAMDAHNPIYIPRNHLVEAALAAATEGDLDPFRDLLAVVTSPYDEQDGLGRFAEPAPIGFDATYQTFCGT